MKKLILIFAVFVSLMGCKSNDPEINLIGTWLHEESLGSMVYNGQKVSLYSLANGEKLTFKANGVCDCGDADTYKVDGNILTATNTKKNQASEFSYEVSGNSLILKQTLSQLQKGIANPERVTALDYRIAYKKQ